MTTTKHFTHRFLRLAQGGLAASLVLIGVVGFGNVASAHDDAIVGVASCSNPIGTGYTVSWTVTNDWDQTEAGTVTSVTGGMATLDASTFAIAAQDSAFTTSGTSQLASVPYLSATLTQELPASASGLITLSTNSTWADGTNVSDSGAAELSGLQCGAPITPTATITPPIVQSLAGHIYLCNNTQPTATEVPGGTLASTGPQTLSSSPNPLGTTDVAPGGYTMTATPPPDYVLVACMGSSVPAYGGNTATEGVTVPAGGSGVGIFYVTNSAPAIASSSPTTKASALPVGSIATSGSSTDELVPVSEAPTVTG